MDIRMLGAMGIRDGETHLSLGGQRRKCLLAVLLLNHGRTVSRSDLADWAWPSTPPDSVDRQIANYISALRSVLRSAGDHVQLVARRPGFAALVKPGLLDTDRFNSLIGQAQLARAGQEYEIAAGHLRAALELWRGRPLEGLETPYLRRRADALEAKRRDAVLLLADIDMAADRQAYAVAHLRELATQHPQDETVTTSLVRALTESGQSAEAADVASRAEHALVRQGRTPGPALRRAHSEALAGRAPNRAARSTAPRYQLPADTGAFTGREDELLALDRIARRAQAGRGAGTVLVCAIDGMAGVGKTALAVHAGHRMADLFPDGQLFVDLHGYSQSTSPRDPAGALATVLQTLGVTAPQLPEGVEARAALYRNRLAGTRTLVVIDNAANEAQVRALLPANDQCLVLVTSRKRFKSLDEAQILPLGLLSVSEAVTLFHQIAGPGRTTAGDPALEEMVALCGQLPLALRISAALLRHRSTWPLARLVEKLRTAPETLTSLSDGDRDLSAVFALSYQALSLQQRNAFGWLGLIPGPDTDAYAVAALLDIAPHAGDDLLQDLVDHNLLSEPAPGRYRMHDLIRQYACTLIDDGVSARDAALDRLLAYYRHTAETANTCISKLTRETPGPGARPRTRHAPNLSTPEDARAWLRAERANLEACLARMAAEDKADQVIALSTGLSELLRVDGPWSLARDVLARTVDTARRAGDRIAEANARTDLGVILRLTGDYAAALENLTLAARLHDTTGSRLGQANAHTELVVVRRLTGDYLGAIGDACLALDRFRELDDRRGQATALAELGAARQGAGDYPGATHDFTRALEISLELDDRRGQAVALTNLALMRRLAGDYPDAVHALSRAQVLLRDLGDRRMYANTLTDLGIIRRLTCDYPGAAASLGEALKIYHDLGDPYGRGIALTERGTVLRIAGDLAGSEQDIADALKIFREIGSRGAEACALNHYAAVFAGTGDVPRAMAIYTDALHMAREVQQPDDEAAALEGIGECLLLDGAEEKGLSHLRQALEITRRLAINADVERLQERVTRLERRT
ncbi:tetratricopeptide (TPR) repeat protein [Catenulispora sp. GP43]|uniref:tetratricopeptide repeat protein n=1 Tax=Catenulispora sp. GP43 TaxID=3156263 RepID=UPI003518015A